jgi:uncharacterized repeat protein (TIGR02059 family)
MRFKLIILFLFMAAAASAQTQLTMEGKSYSNSADTWVGVNIPRTVPTKLLFKNNTITSTNRYGYMLQAGDESPVETNNNLDGAVITGNKFNWSGTDMTVIPHGLFTGHNRNVVAKYNYLNYVPMGIIRKSGNSMSNTGGGVAYNIVKSGAVAVVVKGMSNVNVYNNTFYTDRTESQTWRPLVNVYTNTDGGRYSIAHGTKIYNNIFYTKYQTFAISIDDAESLTGLECDYNIYWCENGSPRFHVNGAVKTFAQWQAMGYDLHSVVMNPGFKDLVNFVPTKRLDYGKDLGAEWKDGLAINAKWGTTDPATAEQNGKWQVGAVVYAATAATTTPGPDYVSSVINNATPDVIEMTFSSTLAGIVPPASSFAVQVNSASRSVASVSISGSKTMLKLQSPVSYGDIITVAYNAGSVALQNTSGGLVGSFTAKSVTNNIVAMAPQFVSAVVEDAAPMVIQTTWSTTLATIVPPDSSFTVKVNNINKPVKGASISDNKVTLTLTEALHAGDVILLSYTKPAVNPLQSASGSAVASISSKTVVNNVQTKAETQTGGEEKFTVSANPVKEYLLIGIINPQPSIVRMMKIFDLSGKLWMEKKLESETSNKVLLELKSGIYILNIEAGSVLKVVQKLIVVQ